MIPPVCDLPTPPIRRRYYHHALPIKAIARRTRHAEETIKTHLRNAHQQLQVLLTDDEKTH